MKKWLVLLVGLGALATGGWLAFGGSGGLEQPDGDAVLAQLNPAPDRVGDGPRLMGQVAYFRLVDRPVDPPAVVWRTLDGDQISLTDYKGKVVLLNFWATWCGPCMEELPSIDNVAAQLSSDDFAVVAINIDDNPERTAPIFADRLQLTALDIFIDPEYRSANALGLRSMPSTFLFDRDGQIIGMMERGAYWDAPESVELLLHYVGAQSQPL